jgi:hypothetical protein
MKKIVPLKTGTANFHQSLQLKEEKAGIAEKEMIGAADSIADATGIGVQLKSKIWLRKEFKCPAKLNSA